LPLLWGVEFAPALTRANTATGSSKRGAFTDASLSEDPYSGFGTRPPRYTLFQLHWPF
jgi:hypothetical protein